MILSEFFTCRVLQEHLVQQGKFQFLPLLAAILDFSEKNGNISETERDKAITSKFLTHRVVQWYPIQNGKVSFFNTFGGHLEF